MGYRQDLTAFLKIALRVCELFPFSLPFSFFRIHEPNFDIFGIIDTA